MSKLMKFYFLFFLHLVTYAQQVDFSGINFQKADDIANQFKGEDLTSLPVLAYKLTNALPTDVEKFRAIYSWVCSNIENDYYAYIKSKNARRRFKKDSVKLAVWNADFSRKAFQKLLKEQKTVCTGYAYLIKELSNYANIKCEIINGYGRTIEDNIGKLSTVNHSWNAVQLNNKWYLCDATWSSGVYDLNEYKFEFNYNDGYFLTNPDLFAKNHYPLDAKWLLTTEQISIDNFLNGPIVYGEAFKHDVISLQPENLKLQIKKNEEVTFILNVKETIDLKDLTVEITSGTHKNTVKPLTSQSKKGFLEIRYVFKNRGSCDFHIKLKEDYLITYAVSVKK